VIDFNSLRRSLCHPHLFVATMTKRIIRRGNNRNDDGDGGIDIIVPLNDLPSCEFGLLISS